MRNAEANSREKRVMFIRFQTRMEAGFAETGMHGS